MFVCSVCVFGRMFAFLVVCSFTCLIVRPFFLFASLLARYCVCSVVCSVWLFVCLLVCLFVFFDSLFDPLFACVFACLFAFLLVRFLVRLRVCLLLVCELLVSCFPCVRLFV